jgi:L-aminopeptidase/D-esterase-like protein
MTSAWKWSANSCILTTPCCSVEWSSLMTGAISTGNSGGFTPGVTSMTAPADGSYDRLQFIPWGYLDPFFEATVQATEEAVANALVANEEMTGRDGHRSPALPRHKVAELFGPI